MAQCPQGHASGADDYCDTCGMPMDAPATAGASAGSPASASPGPDAASAGATGTDAGGNAAGHPCPNCRATNPADALFCEACGYDYTTGTMPRPVETNPFDLDADTPTNNNQTGSGTSGDDAGAGDEATDAAAAETGAAADAGFTWVVEYWIDPDWYELQDSPDPLPSAGLPEIIPLRKDSLLIGRPSTSRSIHPDIDCDPDSGVSRRQAQLTTDGSRWWVEDLDSANGTFVADAAAPLPETPIPVGQKTEVRVGERIYVGGWTRLVIRRATEDEQQSL